MKVLTVDDNKYTTDLVSKFFEINGIEHVETNDPLEGLEQIRKQDYDVILLDIAMPDFSGINIIDTLEQEKILQEKKVFIFSVLPTSSKQVAGLLKRKGIQGYLKKPIELHKLLTSISA